MFVGTNYTTNEIAGSFWRPHDYMSKVPTEHVTGVAPAINVTLSPQGISLAQKLNSNMLDYAGQNENAFAQTQAQDADVLFSSEDGTVSRYNFNIHTGEVNMVNIAV